MSSRGVMHKLPDNLFLTGFMGAGKSTVGKALARKLGWRFVDTDKKIESKAKMRIPKIFSTQGERAFRKIEASVIRQIAGGKRQVISLGGGALINAQSRNRIRSAGALIYLKASAVSLEKRVTAQKLDRPLLAGTNGATRVRKIRSLLAKRKRYYALADWTINTDRRRSQDVVKAILEILK